MFLGIDIGTFETKGVLVDESGVVRASAARRHEISTPHPGHVEQDADDVWWSDVAYVAQILMASDAMASQNISAMAVSAIGPCVLPVSEKLEALRPGILYGIDTRAHEQIEQLNTSLGDKAIFARSANVLTSQSAGPKIKWIVDNEPEIAQRTRWFMTSQSYLVAKLTGNVTIDHGTAGYYHPLYDLASQSWDVSGCEDFISENQLPSLGWATDIAGTVTQEASALTGIPEGTPVLVGTTDSPAEAVGAGVVSPGDVMLQYGSAGYMITVMDQPQASEKLWSAPFVFPGTFVSAAGTATAGTVTRWVADLLGLDSSQGDQKLFSELITLASDSPVGANGLVMLPHLSGERTPVQDPHSTGVFHGFTLSHTRADLARAALEGVAHSLAWAFMTFAEEGINSTAISAIGGGTKNPIILASVSALTEKTQNAIDSAGAAYGDAVLSAIATGHFAQPSDAAAWLSIRETVSPDAAWSKRLLADHADYRALYEANRALSHSRSARLDED